jgi:hypothetical protein
LCVIPLKYQQFSSDRNLCVGDRPLIVYYFI